MYDERLVDAHQFLNPRIDEQVVANGYLHRVAAFVHQQDGEEARVEYDVAMVGDIGISFRLVGQFAPVERHSASCLFYKLLQNAVAKRFLECKFGFAGAHLLGNSLERDTGHHSSHYLPESRVGYQFFKNLRQLLVMIGANLIKFRIHIISD